MTRYERRVLAVDDDGGFDVEGRIVAVLDSPRAGARQITVLVELDSEPTVFHSPGDPEGITEDELAEAYRDLEHEPTPPKATFFCGAEKSDGEPCGREVDEPDDTCWQHP
jgi:hypothetical protein